MSLVWKNCHDKKLNCLELVLAPSSLWHQAYCSTVAVLFRTSIPGVQCAGRDEPVNGATSEHRVAWWNSYFACKLNWMERCNKIEMLMLCNFVFLGTGENFIFTFHSHFTVELKKFLFVFLNDIDFIRSICSFNAVAKIGQAQHAPCLDGLPKSVRPQNRIKYLRHTEGLLVS